MVPEHPGLYLAAVIAPSLRAAGVTNGQFAELLGMARPTLQHIMAGRAPITAPTAARLSALFGRRFGEAILCQQQLHDLGLLQRELEADLAGLPDLTGVPLKSADAPPLLAAA